PGIGLLLGFAIIVTVLFHRDKLSSFLDTVNSHETKPGPIPSATAPSSTSASPTSLLSPNAASPTPPPPPTGRVQRQSISEAAPTPAAFSSADANERARRQQIIASLRKEYVEELTKRRFIVRDGFLWRNEIPPTAWTNEKLREMGESWSIKNRYTDMQTDQLRNAAAKFIAEIKNISSGFPQAARDLHQERLKQLNAAKTDDERKKIEEQYRGLLDGTIQRMNFTYEECCKRDGIELRDALMDRIGPGAGSQPNDVYERITPWSSPGFSSR